MQILHDPAHGIWIGRPDAAVVWTRPESVIESFGDALRWTSPAVADLMDEVDRFADLLIRMTDRVPTLLVPTWVLSTSRRGLGIGDLGSEGAAGLLARMNGRLVEKLAGVPGLFLLNTAKWIETVGATAFNPKLWYTSKTPFSVPVFRLAASDVKAALRALSGSSRKLIVLDLDDTLWGGIVGDAGWRNLRLGGHDPIGEAFSDFQNELKALRRRGVLLAIVSKNDESIALEAIRQHPEMVLRLDDFVGWRINWDDKAANIVSLLAELNLGVESAVFVDDNPAERARVREALPDVLVPEWPNERMLYAQALTSLSCFDTPTVSQEDRQRTQLYDREQRRRAGSRAVGSLDEWLASLGLVVNVEELDDTNCKRIAQLLNKTNQMNLATRRLGEAQLRDWVASGRRKVWGFRASDRFGDSGLTGVVSTERDGEAIHVRDFVLSCRVFGRQIERAMLHTAIAEGRRDGCLSLHAQYRPTDRNKPCFEFLSHSGLAYHEGDNTFEWDLAMPFEPPAFITLVHDHVKSEDSLHRG